MKKYIIPVIALMMVLNTLSCKKYLKEELVSTLTNDYYTTDQGLEDLVRSAYTPVRFKFENEQAYALFNFGTDEFIEGDQFNYEYYNSYNAPFNPSEGLINNLWTNNYQGIARCNVGLEDLPLFKGASKTIGTPAQITQRLAELHFLRGYYYFQLVQQFAGVPLVLHSISSKVTDFPRASVADVYKQIFTDLRFAADNLLPTTTDQGRATKGAAEHFLAKAYLTRGSAVTDARGQQPTDIDSAAYYADLVINDKADYQLETDFMNIWNGVYPNGYPKVTTPPIGQNGTAPAGDYSKFQAAQQSKEIIFAAQFIKDLTLNGSSGNRTHEYYICQYDVGIPGLLRNVDNFNGRPYRRLGPSDYTIDLFDRKNDSRFYKSFRTVFYRNANDVQDKTVPVFTTNDAPTPALVGVKKYGVGDTAALFIVNDRNNPLTAAQIAKYRYTVYARYFTTPATGATIQQGFNNNKYLTLVKMLDPVRVTSDYNEERGVRNGILARLAETYLIAAEAYGRLGNYTKALEYVNVIRQRAAYHQGEFKNPQTWMFDGVAKDDVSDTYNNFKATETLFSTNAPSENYPASATTEATRFIHFMLNERTRELCGEFYRWEDLARTETLYERTKKFNKDAVSIAERDKLRPIPQVQIDATTINNQPMTPDQKKAYQNPGW